MAATPTVAGAPTASKAARTRETLRQAAIHRFVEDGFDAARVADIAADVGLTERTFYRHFATKDEALFGDIHEQVGWFRAALYRRPSDEHLVDSAVAAINSFPGDPRVMLEIARLRSSLLSSDRIVRYLRELQGVLAAELRQVVRGRLAEGLDVELHAAVYSEILSGAVFAAISVWSEATDEPDVADLAQHTSAALEIVRGAIPPATAAIINRVAKT